MGDKYITGYWDQMASEERIEFIRARALVQAARIAGVTIVLLIATLASCDSYLTTIRDGDPEVLRARALADTERRCVDACEDTVGRLVSGEGTPTLRGGWSGMTSCVESCRKRACQEGKP